MTRREASRHFPLRSLRVALLALAPLAAHCGSGAATPTAPGVDGGVSNDAATGSSDGGAPLASDRPAGADAAAPDPRCEPSPACLAACTTTFGACSTCAGPCAMACETSANTCAASCDTAAMSCRAACGNTTTCIAGCNALPAGAARNACVSACNACEPSCRMTQTMCAAGCAMARRDCDAACGVRCGLGAGATCATARDRCNDACRPPCASDAGAPPDPSSVSGFCADFCARVSQVDSCADYASQCVPQCEQLYDQLSCDAPRRAAAFTCMRARVQVTACEVPSDNPGLGLQPVYDIEPCASELSACGF